MQLSEIYYVGMDIYAVDLHKDQVYIHLFGQWKHSNLFKDKQALLAMHPKQYHSIFLANSFEQWLTERSKYGETSQTTNS